MLQKLCHEPKKLIVPLQMNLGICTGIALGWVNPDVHFKSRKRDNVNHLGSNVWDAEGDALTRLVGKMFHENDVEFCSRAKRISRGWIENSNELKGCIITADNERRKHGRRHC